MDPDPRQQPPRGPSSAAPEHDAARGSCGPPQPPGRPADRIPPAEASPFAIVEIAPRSLPPPADGYVDLFGDDTGEAPLSPPAARERPGDAWAGTRASVAAAVAAAIGPPTAPRRRVPVPEALVALGFVSLGVIVLAFGPRLRAPASPAPTPGAVVAACSAPHEARPAKRARSRSAARLAASRAPRAQAGSDAFRTGSGAGPGAGAVGPDAPAAAPAGAATGGGEPSRGDQVAGDVGAVEERAATAEGSDATANRSVASPPTPDPPSFLPPAPAPEATARPEAEASGASADARPEAAPGPDPSAASALAPAVTAPADPSGPRGLVALATAPARMESPERKPRLADPGCVREALRIPPSLADAVGESAKVRLEIAADGSVADFQLLSGSTDPRIAEAVRSAVARCAFVPGVDPDGRPARRAYVLGIDFVQR